MNKGAGPRHTTGTIEKAAGMEAVRAPAKAISPQERAIQTVRPALRRATAVRGMTAGGRAGVHPGLMAMTVLSVTTVQAMTTGRAAMIVRAGMTAVAVTTVRTGKAARIGRASPTVQTVQIGQTVRTGLIGPIGPIGPISRGGRIGTTVRTDRAGRTERAVEVLLTTALATGGLAAIVLANLLARVATNPRLYGASAQMFLSVPHRLV